ncbi:hypothetical protein L7F22_069179 [Adiantum nelumboides]|nr:hypothetical protein [Adiantum nelumboides]
MSPVTAPGPPLRTAPGPRRHRPQEPPMPNMIFVNLPVGDLDAAKAFYSALGFTLNEQFSDERTASFVVSDAIVVMVMAQDRFREFTEQPGVADPRTAREAGRCPARPRTTASCTAAASTTRTATTSSSSGWTPRPSPGSDPRPVRRRRPRGAATDRADRRRPRSASGRTAQDPAAHRPGSAAATGGAGSDGAQRAHLADQPVDGERVAVDAEPDDDPGRDRRDERVVPELLAPVHVRDVHLDRRELGALDRVVQRDGGVGVGGGVEDQADRVAALHRGTGLVDPVDEDALVVGLAEVQLEVVRGGRLPAQRLDVGEHGGPVHLRLAGAEQVEARLVGQHDQLRAVPGAELGHRAADVGLRRRRAHVQAGGDLVVGQPGRDLGEDLPLAVGELAEPDRAVGAAPGARRELGDQGAGDRRGEQRLPAVHHPDGVDEVGRFGVLDQEPAGAAADRVEDVGVLGERGQDDHPGAGELRVAGDLPGRGDAVGAGHADVHEDDVRVVLAGRGDGLCAVGGLGDDVQVGLRAEQRAEPGADERLVVGEQDPDHLSAPGVVGRSGTWARPGRSVAPAARPVRSGRPERVPWGNARPGRSPGRQGPGRRDPGRRDPGRQGPGQQGRPGARAGGHAPGSPAPGPAPPPGSRRPSAHARACRSARAVHRAGRRAGTVVVDGQVQRVVAEPQGDHRATGPGVPTRVGQRLLHDPVRRQVDPGRQRPRGPLGAAAHRQPRGAHLVEQRVEPVQAGGGRTRGLLVDPTQHAEGGAHLAQQVAAGPLDLGERGAGLLRVVVHQVERDPGLHVDQGDVVAEHVVQLLGDPQPLGVGAAPTLGLGGPPGLRRALAPDPPEGAARDERRQPGQDRRGRRPRDRPPGHEQPPAQHGQRDGHHRERAVVAPRGDR